MLAHLTNGLLNQRLNPLFDAEKHVWKGDQFREALAKRGVDYYKVIHPQVREIVATAMAATLPRMKAEVSQLKVVVRPCMYTIRINFNKLIELDSNPLASALNNDNPDKRGF